MAQRGIKTVPVFWIATEDHDFAEVATSEFINRDCALSGVEISGRFIPKACPVGHGNSGSIDRNNTASASVIIAKTEFTDDLEKLLRDCYSPGKKFGDGLRE
jgi:uncharacterized protein YllA (UPF0747 family)